MRSSSTLIHRKLMQHAGRLAALLLFVAIAACSQPDSNDSGNAKSTKSDDSSVESEGYDSRSDGDSDEYRTVLVEGEKSAIEQSKINEFANAPTDKSASKSQGSADGKLKAYTRETLRGLRRVAPNARPMASRMTFYNMEEEVSEDLPAGEVADKSAAAKRGELWARRVITSGEETKIEEIAFPLKQTDVKASISGFVASTSVTQSYENPFTEAIEAVYVFPLPQNSAVNGFEMVIGNRKIVGAIKKKEEAQEIYDQAKAEGFTASMLSQNRPNIFTQSIANIAPKAAVDIDITYFHRLERKAGMYEYHFPMVVGPRYGGHTPDIAAITPNELPEGMRNGHNISVNVQLDAGVSIADIKVPSHKVQIDQHNSAQATITLSNEDTIPNRDFVLRFDVIGADLNQGVMTHAGETGKYVSLMLTPPAHPNEEELSAREITFVMDTSGSMRGKPLDISKKIISTALDGLRHDDLFNIFFFAGGNGQLWETAQPNTPDNVAKAKSYVDGMKGSGGTEMLAGLERAFGSHRGHNRLRMVVFLSDGYVGNESGIHAFVKNNTDSSRFYALGVGGSVNRHLIEGIGKHGRGHAEIVLNREIDDTDAIVKRFFSHIDAPVMTDIEIDWNGLEVIDQYPAKVKDVFKGHPVSVVARYTVGGSGEVIVRGRRGGELVEYSVPVSLPEFDPRNGGLGPIWARAKIEELHDMRLGAEEDRRSKLNDEITNVALNNRLVSEFTSFVAVDSSQKVSDGNPKKVDVPVEQPEDVDRETTR